MVTESPKGFQCFKRHHNFHHVKVGSEAESANTEGAEAFKEDLHRIIVNEKYVPERVFSDNETSSFSECVLGHSYTCQQSKSAKIQGAETNNAAFAWKCCRVQMKAFSTLPLREP